MFNNQLPLSRYSTTADRDFVRLEYNAKQTSKQLKKEPKKIQTSSYSTLEEAIEKNMQSFETKKKKNPKKSTEVERDQIEYLLDSVEFIKELYEKEVEVEPSLAPSNADKVFQVKSVKHNNTNFQKYLYSVEKVVNEHTIEAVTEKLTNQAVHTCDCGGTLIVVSAESIFVCEVCGKTETLVDSYSFHDQNDSMAYKRSNHLVECLNALQAKEGTHVPNEVIDAVRAEFKKHRISSSKDIKPAKVKQFLKKLGYSAYYDNIYSITNAITGLPTLKLSASLEKKFRDMFAAIQIPFEKHKPPNRKNFLSYNYTLYKFSELLGEDELLPYFSLLKCKQNLHVQDQIWRAICDELSWQYIPTV
ncbi:putative transcription factor [Paramecium bursaria Chlorella virus NE-JV-1]|nr:putative transcription factor [Paramecium bursaria Chlorella virus NE-JV-1]